MKTTKLWLRSTSRYPDIETWPLIRTAYESVEASLRPGQVMPSVIVKLTNTYHGFCGRAHWIERHPIDPKHIYAGSVRWHRVLVRVGPAKSFPCKVSYHRFKDMPEYECLTYREAVVMVTAHEIQHCLGESGRKAGEFICEMAAWDAIERYRKNQAEIDGEIDEAFKRIATRQETKIIKLKLAKNPEFITQKKLAAAQAALAKWQRKAKIANNKVKKYSRSVKHYTKKAASLVPVKEPLALAATTEIKTCKHL